MTTRRKIDPFPLELLYDEPLFLVMPAVARGMALNLIWQFWFTDCRPLPDLDSQRFSLAQANSGPWAMYRVAIRACLDSLLPKLETRRAYRHEKLEKLRRMADKGNSMRKLRALEKQAPLELQASAPSLGPERRSERRPRTVAPGDDGKLFK